MAVLKASPPTFGESVLGAALIWIALHWRQTYVAGRCSLSPRLAACINGECPRIVPLSVVELGSWSSSSKLLKIEIKVRVGKSRRSSGQRHGLWR